MLIPRKEDRSVLTHHNIQINGVFMLELRGGDRSRRDIGFTDTTREYALQVLDNAGSLAEEAPG